METEKNQQLWCNYLSGIIPQIEERLNDNEYNDI